MSCLIVGEWESELRTASGGWRFFMRSHGARGRGSLRCLWTTSSESSTLVVWANLVVCSGLRVGVRGSHTDVETGRRQDTRGDGDEAPSRRARGPGNEAESAGNAASVDWPGYDE